MGTTSSIFTGSSNFAQDFQNVISRATAISSLPITQLTRDQTTLTSQSTAMSGLDTKFQALQSAVQGLADSLTGSAFQADVSDPNVASVTLSTGAAEGNYSVDVVAAGAYATSISGTWAADTGPTKTYQLSLGGVNYALSPGDNSAGSVVLAINSQYGDKVHATLVNVGSSIAADYRISMQAVKLGDLQPGLLVSTPANLQAQQTHGSNTLATSQTALTWDPNPAVTYKLSIGGATYEISSLDTTAQAMAAAINLNYSDKVTAVVVDVSANGAPDYRMNLTAAKPGDAQPDILITDGIAPPVSIQAQQVAGSDTRATSRTLATWAGAAGPALGYQLALGGVKYAITVANNSADSLVSAINTQYGDKVTAAKIDLGTDGAHDYRISLTAVNPGDLQPGIVASATMLQKQQTPGALAEYIVNNSGLHVTGDTRSVTIAAGTTVNLLAKDSGVPVNITVTRPTSAVSTALSAFATAYNAAVDAVDQQHGATSGPLAGQSILGELSRTLSRIGTYSSATGSINGLSALGLDLDKTGHLTFNVFSLLGSDIANSSGVTDFLGSTSQGFLKLATDSLSGIEDSVTGLLPTTEASVKSQIASSVANIADQQAKVDAMTQAMQERMAAADALISSMEQQYNYISGMFQAMQASSAQYK